MTLPPELQAEPDFSKHLEFELMPALALSIEIRVPTFTADDSAGFKVEKLEEWVLGTAAVAGGLCRERLEAHVALAADLESWEQLEAGFGKTGADRRQAKAMLRPDLDRRIRVLRWRIERLTEEIDRLEREYAKVSRAYTMIAGST